VKSVLRSKIHTAIRPIIEKKHKTGNTAYHNDAGGGPSHGHRQHPQKLVKIARVDGVVPEISSRTDRQIDR